MTKITPWKEKDEFTAEINTKGIGKVRKNYLKKLELSSLTDIPLEKANKLFVNVIEDFKKGKLSSDELSDFASELFHGVGQQYPDSDLFQAILSASELSFAIRSEAVYTNIRRYLADIDKFYQHNK